MTKTAKRVSVGLDKNGMAAQGELLLRRVPKLPRGLKPMKAEKGHLIVGHSETGHHHVLPAKDAVLYQNPSNPLLMYAQIKSDTTLQHLRDYDTHQSIALEKGAVVEVRVGREFRDNVAVRSQD